MSSNLRSVRNVGEDITFLYRKPRLMQPILPRNRSDAAVPKVMPSHVDSFFITPEHLINRKCGYAYVWVTSSCCRGRNRGKKHFGLTHHTVKKGENPFEEWHYRKYSSIGGLEEVESWPGHTAFLSRPCLHRTCHPNQLQAAATLTFSRNVLSCLLN